MNIVVENEVFLGRHSSPYKLDYASLEGHPKSSTKKSGNSTCHPLSWLVDFRAESYFAPFIKYSRAHCLSGATYVSAFAYNGFM